MQDHTENHRPAAIASARHRHPGSQETTRIWPALAGLLAIALLLVAGCRSTPRVFTSPYVDFSEFYPETVDRLAQVLAERHPAWDTLQTEADITIDTPTQGRKRFSANLLVDFPDKARLRGSKMALGTLFEILSVGNMIHVYFNRDGILFSGRPSDLDESAGFLRLVGPDEILRALLAERDLAAQLQKPGRFQVRETTSHWQIWASKPDGSWQIWVVRKADFLVEETVLGQEGEGARARVRYWAYDEIEGEPVPSDLQIFLADPDVTIRVETEYVDINPPLRPEVFVPPAVDQEHWFPLDRMRLDPLDEN
jgi:hypothetical protein